VRSPKGVHDAVSELPEQTWARAWRGMVPKRAPSTCRSDRRGRHKFGLRPDGSVFYRTNNRYLVRCPGRDTPGLQGDRERMDVSFGLPRGRPNGRSRRGVCRSGSRRGRWTGCAFEQAAFVTPLEGTDPGGRPPGRMPRAYGWGGSSFPTLPVVRSGRALSFGFSARAGGGRERRWGWVDPVRGKGPRFLDPCGLGELRAEGRPSGMPST